MVRSRNITPYLLSAHPHILIPGNESPQPVSRAHPQTVDLNNLEQDGIPLEPPLTSCLCPLQNGRGQPLQLKYTNNVPNKY